MDTIPWVLLKEPDMNNLEQKLKVSVDTIPWVLLKGNGVKDNMEQAQFQWILFLGSYLKSNPGPEPGSDPGFSGYYSLGLT